MEVEPKLGRLLIVDGHAYAYRAFHAISRLTGPSGQPTNAIYGFIKMLQRLQADLKPTHQVVIWDGGLDAERLVILPEYKAQRPSMPEELQSQLGEITDYLDAVATLSIQQEGVEADDWIASVAFKAVTQNLQVVIASSDKDFLQLVNDAIGLSNPNDKDAKIWNAMDVEAKTGVCPHQVVDWLSLIGDSVDNISGVSGVGPKTAAKLLQCFGSVDNLYARISEVQSEKIRASLVASQSDVRRNQQMIRLKTNLELEADVESLRMRKADFGRLRELYTRWGFRTMLAEVESKCPRQKELL